MALPEAFLDHAESVGWRIPNGKVEGIGDIDHALGEWRLWAHDYWEGQQCAWKKGAVGVRLSEELPDPSIVPEWVARLYGVVPLRHDGPTLVLAASELLRASDIDALSFLLRSEVAFISAGAQVQEFIHKYYAGGGSAASTRDEMSQAYRDLIYLLDMVVANEATELECTAMDREGTRLQFRVDGVMYPTSLGSIIGEGSERRLEVLSILMSRVPVLSGGFSMRLMVRGRAVRLVSAGTCDAGIAARLLLLHDEDCEGDPWPIPMNPYL